MANMLPPFVPPSARVPSESLPLITEFVIERGARTSATVTAPPPAVTPTPTPTATATPPRAPTSEDATELPSIDDFLMRPVAAEQHPETARAAQPEGAATSEHQQPDAASQVEPGPRPPDQPAAGLPPQVLEREEGEPIPPAQTEVILPPISADASEVKESTPPGARFNDEAADVQVEAPGITMGEAWEASAVSPAVAGEQAAERAEVAEERDGEQSEPERGQPEHEGAAQDEWGEQPTPATAGGGAPADTAWVAEERDAFDWNSVGTIATGPDEARRAEEAWSDTEWEPRRNPEHEQVATALVQLARRVRAGEVKVELPANATIEASLAAVLAALLAGEERQDER